MSFAKKALRVLVDLRVWVVVLLYAMACLLADLLWGPRIFAIIAAPLGLVAACMLAQLDPRPEGVSLSFSELIHSKNLLAALAGILILQGAEAIPRFVVLPWHWLYGEHIETHTWAVVLASSLDWLSFAVAGWCIGYLVPKRALFASMVGVAVFLPITVTELLTSESSNRALLTFAREMKWLNEPDFDLSSFKAGAMLGAMIGLFARAALTIYTARLVSSRVPSSAAEQ